MSNQSADYVHEAARRSLETWRTMPRHLRERAVSMGLIDEKWLDYEGTPTVSEDGR